MAIKFLLQLYPKEFIKFTAFIIFIIWTDDKYCVQFLFHINFPFFFFCMCTYFKLL